MVAITEKKRDIKIVDIVWGVWLLLDIAVYGKVIWLLFIDISSVRLSFRKTYNL